MIPDQILINIENTRFLWWDRRRAAQDKLRSHIRTNGRDYRFWFSIIYRQLAAKEFGKY